MRRTDVVFGTDHFARLTPTVKEINIYREIEKLRIHGLLDAIYSTHTKIRLLRTRERGNNQTHELIHRDTNKCTMVGEGEGQRSRLYS